MPMSDTREAREALAVTFAEGDRVVLNGTFRCQEGYGGHAAHWIELADGSMVRVTAAALREPERLPQSSVEEVARAITKANYSWTAGEGDMHRYYARAVLALPALAAPARTEAVRREALEEAARVADFYGEAFGNTTEPYRQRTVASEIIATAIRALADAKPAERSAT